MSNDNAPQHSGSRWEPATTTDPDRTSPATAFGSASTGVRPSEERDRRRRRGPLLAVFAAVLALGASSAGIAYVQAAQEPGTSDRATVADAPHDRGSGVGDGDGDGRWADHHHDGDRGGDGPGARGGGDAGADWTIGELPS